VGVKAGAAADSKLIPLLVVDSRADRGSVHEEGREDNPVIPDRAAG